MDLNKIYQGDSLEVLKTFPSESINCVMTSPPYWALRNYGVETECIWDEKENCEHKFEMKIGKNPMDRGGKGQHDFGGIVGKMGDNTMTKINSGFCSKCGAWKGQLGLEPTFDLYIKHLCDIFDEVKRVLRKDGTCWVNMGDTYAGSGVGHKPEHFWNENEDGTPKNKFAYKQDKDKVPTQPPKEKHWELNNIQDKSLCNIPARFSIEMQNRGWILRNVIIWHKPNCMPSSVKDRFTVDFEYVFFFVKSKRYYFEQQFESLAYFDKRGNQRIEYNGKLSKAKKNNIKGIQAAYMGQNQELGKNKRCVWTITTKPFKEAHFATYPEELCYTPIKAGCPEFVCNKCGKAREIIKVKIGSKKVPPIGGVKKCNGDNPTYSGNTEQNIYKEGLTDCNCNAGFSGGIVLDPFFGAGTTGLVALKQNKQFIGIELNPEYIKIAEARIKPYLVPIK